MTDRAGRDSESVYEIMEIDGKQWMEARHIHRMAEYASSLKREKEQAEKDRDAARGLLAIHERTLRNIERLEEKADAASWMVQCEDAQNLLLKIVEERDALRSEADRFRKALEDIRDRHGLQPLGWQRDVAEKALSGGGNGL